MSRSTVSAFAVKSDGTNGSLLDHTTTDSKGSFTLIIGKTSDPLRLTASGGSYASEMNGVAISSPSAVSRVLLAPKPGQSGISIHPLTDFVNSIALAITAAGTPFNTAVTDAVVKVQSFYGLATAPGNLVPDYTAAGVGKDAGNLGLILGAIVSEDQYLCPGSPGGLVTALSKDLSDGIFDGMATGKPVPYCGGNLPAIAGTSIFQDALSGLEQMQLVIRAFSFGGAGNILTANGLADLATGGSTAYPIAPLAAINTAIPQAAPTLVNSFAPPSETPSMNDARYSAIATLLPNGKVLLAGGIGNSSVYLRSTELYDPATSSFAPASQTAAMNGTRYLATATLLPNGKVLIAGGLSSSGSSTDLYDAAANSFAATTPSMNIARFGATATILPNGKVLIAGGRGAITALNSTELYDPALNSFQPAGQTAVMNVRRFYATATILPNGKVLIAGGLSEVASSLGSTELYDPATSSFAPASQTAAMNGMRYYATATLLPNGKVLIAGGYSKDIMRGSPSIPLSSTELYDPASNSFATATPSMNAARGNATATLLPNGKVLIAGRTDSSTPLPSTELYDPATNSFAPVSGTATMNVPRMEATATLLPNGKILVAGGNDSSVGTLAGTELYTP